MCPEEGSVLPFPGQHLCPHMYSKEVRVVEGVGVMSPEHSA